MTDAPLHECGRCGAPLARGARWCPGCLAPPSTSRIIDTSTEVAFFEKRPAARILGTASDLGAAGVDPIYGHGLVNAQAAVKG